MLVKETPYSLTLCISKTCSTQNIKMVIIIIFFYVKCHICLNSHIYHQWQKLITMTSQWARLRLKSPASRLFLRNRLFRCRSKKTSKLRVIGLCEGNPSVTGGFRPQRGSNAENVYIWWRHHAESSFDGIRQMKTGLQGNWGKADVWALSSEPS